MASYNLQNIELYEYQCKGIEYALKHKHIIIGDEMGCCAGDTTIKINRGGSCRQFTLKKVYERFEKSWRSDIPTKTASVVDGDHSLRLNTIKKVIYSGKKECLKITVKSDTKTYSITCTPDHEISAEIGWVRSDELKIGSKVLVNGKFRDKDGYYRVTDETKNHPNCTTSGVYEHRLKIEAQINHLEYEEYLFRLSRGAIEGLSFLSQELVVRHKDGIKINNSLDNLEVVSNSEHMVIHADVKNIPGMTAHYGKVIKIETVGVKDTYDLVMMDPHRNFVANGVVVHNCGKTIQALGVSSSTGKRTLIVCPSYLICNWKNEIEKFCPNLNADIISYSIQSLRKNRFLFKEAEVIICDEIQYLKNPQAQRTDFIHDLIRSSRPEYLIGLSGTPIQNRVVEWFSLIYLLGYSCNLNGVNLQKLSKVNTYRKFGSYFSHAVRMKVNGITITQYRGYQNIEQLKKILKGKYIRRRADEVLSLPDKVYLNRQLNKNDKHLEEAWNEFCKTGAVSTLKKDAAIAKTKYTIPYVKELLDQDKQVVVFTDHVDSAKLIAQALNLEVITGSTPVDRRHLYVTQLNEGKISGIVGTIGSCSTGFNMTSANHVVFNDLSWVPASNLQAEKRIHRIGQNNKCFYHTILLGKMDLMITESLRAKIEVLEKSI